MQTLGARTTLDLDSTRKPIDYLSPTNPSCNSSLQVATAKYIQSAMAEKIEANCTHNYTRAPNLLPDTPSLSVCAPCLINFFITDIELAQAVLARRGGIFGSWSAGFHRDEQRKLWMTHRDCTNQWRKAKISCMRGVELLEKLRDEHPEDVEKWGLDEALYIWELKKDGCCCVPGLPGFRTEEEQEEFEKKKEVEEAAAPENKEVVASKPSPKEELRRKAAPEAKQAAVSEPSPKEEESADDGWEVVKRKWKMRRQPSEVASPGEDTTKPDEDKSILQEMKAVTDKLEDTKVASKNDTHVLTEPGDNPTWPATRTKKQRKKTQDIGTAEVKNARGQPSTPVDGKPPKDATPSTPRPVLKRRTTTPPPNKTVKITDEAIILPTEDASPVKKPHNKHAFAENRRKHAHFRRGTRWHQRGVWASPPGHEKVNTSHPSTGWITYERLQNEDEEPKEEQKPIFAEPKFRFKFSDPMLKKKAEAESGVAGLKPHFGSFNVWNLLDGKGGDRERKWAESARKAELAGNTWMNGRRRVLRVLREDTSGAVGELEGISAVKKWAEPESER
jgi:hypothetical protein